MKVKSLLLLGVISGSLFLSACNTGVQFPAAQKSAPTSSSSVNGSITILPAKDQNVTGSITITDPTTPTNAMSEKSNQETSQTSSITTPYSAAKLADLKGKEPVAIFFHATWCPVCQAMDKNLATEPEKIPNGVTILKADYDTEDSLKKEYQVVQQSTWVVLDKTGKEVARNPGFDYASVIGDLQKAL